jgi:protein phosphatase 4 regulatory subunit 3
LKFFRTLLGLQDEFYYNQIIQNQVFSHIIDIVYETMPRDNLLNSACLELFEFVKRENIKPILFHVVENYRQRLQDITYVDVFENFVNRYDQSQGFGQEVERNLFGQEEDTTPLRTRINGANERWQGVRGLDADEEQYFNTSDDEDELARSKTLLSNGTSPLMKPLVDYPDDDDEAATSKFHSFYQKPPDSEAKSDDESSSKSPKELPPTPPERLAEKRRREEDEEDELGKLSGTSKRRNSSSASSVSSVGSSTGTGMLRKKKSFTASKDTNSKKMTISLAVKSPNGIEGSKE